MQNHPIIIDGKHLTIEDAAQVAIHNRKVSITNDEEVIERVAASHAYVIHAVENNKPIYGVTTSFGGMSNLCLSKEEAAELQNNIAFPHKTGAGNILPIPDIRAGMLLRMNSLLQGISGIRLEIIRRFEIFLNEGVTPHVHEFGSIGASGDMVPLSYLLGSVIGLDSSFKVNFKGEVTDSLIALERLGLPRIELAPKEGLAVINGTSMMTGIAVNSLYHADILLALSLGSHALFIQGLNGTNQSFHPFIHQYKPQPGQIWIAEQMLQLLSGSKLIKDELNGNHNRYKNGLIQDRYSMRCLPQYMGPIAEGFANVFKQVEIEINSVTDNPLIDVENNADYHCGNFLGEYIGIGMDQMRYYIGMLAKHLDVQIALLVAPEFNRGLSPSLVGNTERKANIGLKGLQISGNSMVPILGFFGNSLADRFPTHAEQFNQNISSQGFGSANLLRYSIELFQKYMAVALIFGVQAVDLRTYAMSGHYDARQSLSPATLPLYEAVLQVVGKTPSQDKPYIWNDNEQSLDEHISRISDDIAAHGIIPQSMKHIAVSQL